jgi:predicted membrane protein
MVMMKLRRQPIDMRCVDTIAQYLLYTFIIDFALEMLDLIHRIYEADESFRSLNFLMHTKLFFSQIVLQILIGTLVPILTIGYIQIFHVPERLRRLAYALCGCLTIVGIFAMRWNVVIGGQLFSKSFLGYTAYKVSLVSREGELIAAALLILPFFILAVLMKILPPWADGAIEGKPLSRAAGAD